MIYFTSHDFQLLFEWQRSVEAVSLMAFGRDLYSLSNQVHITIEYNVYVQKTFRLTFRSDLIRNTVFDGTTLTLVREMSPIKRNKEKKAEWEKLVN